MLRRAGFLLLLLVLVSWAAILDGAATSVLAPAEHVPGSKVEVSTVGSGPQELTAAELAKLVHVVAAIGTDPEPESKVEVSTVGDGPQGLTAAELEKLAQSLEVEREDAGEKAAEHSTVEEVVR